MKKYLLPLLIMISAACAFVFAGCFPEENEDAHEHTFSAEWTFDEEYHWHEAVCGHDEVSGRAAHTFDGDICTVCGYEKRPDPHVHAFGEWETVIPATCTEKGEECRFCACGESESRQTDPLGHDAVEHAGKAATCTEAGWEEYQTCTRCDYSTYKELPANGHTEVTDAAVAPTCTDEGLTEGKHCSVCHAVLIAQQAIPANGHTEVTDAAVAPTCTDEGLTEGKHCSVCHAVLIAQQAIPANGHSRVYHAAAEPGCTVPGWEAYYTCENCDYTTYKEIPAGHTILALDGTETRVDTDEVYDKSLYGTIEFDDPSAANCSAPSEAHFICSRCNVQAAIMALAPHTIAGVSGEYEYSSGRTYAYYMFTNLPVDKVPQLCTDVATAATRCEVCGEELTVKLSGGHTTINNHGERETHDGDYVYQLNKYPEINLFGNTPEDCGVTGYGYFVCLDCAQDVFTYVQLPHTIVNRFGDGLEFDDEKYYSSDEFPDIVPDGQLNDCSERGTGTLCCAICEAKLQVKIVGPHKLVFHEGKEPTCTEEGRREYYTCENCDYTSYRALPLKEHVIEDVNGERWKYYEYYTYDLVKFPNARIEGDYICGEERTAYVNCAECGSELAITVLCAHVFYDNEGNTVYWDESEVYDPSFSPDFICLGNIPMTCEEGSFIGFFSCRCCIQDFIISLRIPHEFTEREGKEPTCTEAGHTAYLECTVCGERSGYEELPATEHRYENGACIYCGLPEPALAAADDRRR